MPKKAVPGMKPTTAFPRAGRPLTRPARPRRVPTARADNPCILGLGGFALQPSPSWLRSPGRLARFRGHPVRSSSLSLGARSFQIRVLSL